MIINPTPAAGAASTHRLKRGTKASDVPSAAVAGSSKDDLLSSIDGPFQLAEYLACKVRADPHDVKGLVEVPKDGHDADRDVWIYEHLRRLPVDLAPLVSQLLAICSRDTCPSMKADEWLYLCVAHGSGGTEECCAIDYILHTLDSTTTLLNSTKNFPSRMSIPAASLNNFPSLSRRLSRIFSHAYFHHREAFLTFEAESSLYARFMALCETYGLVGSSLLVIPRDEIGLQGHAEEDSDEEDEIDEEEEDEDEDEQDKEAGAGEEAGSAASRNASASPIKLASTAENGEHPNGDRSKRAKSLDRRSSQDVPRDSDLRVRNGNSRTHVRPVARVQAAKANPTPSKAGSSDETNAMPAGADAVQAKPGSDGKEQEEEALPVKIPDTAVKATTRGRGTLGRGKQARGTVLWSSDTTTPPPVPVSKHGGEESEKDQTSAEEGAE